MKYYLCEFSRDWADEFQAKGAWLFTQDEKEQWERSIKNTKRTSVTVYFGTNEGWEGEDVEDFADSYVFHEISKSTYDELKPLMTFGIGIFPHFVDYL